MEKREISLEKYKVYEGLITDITEDGEGIARIEGFTVFAVGGVIGDVARIKLTDIKKSFARGQVVGVVSESEFKVKAKCKHFAKCGGCDMQDVSYEKQLDIKTGIVKNALERIGKLENVQVMQCMGMDEPWKYRNKVVFHVDGRKVGLKAKNTNDIIEVSECPIIPDGMVKALSFVRKMVKEFTARKAPFHLTSVIMRMSSHSVKVEGEGSLMLDFRIDKAVGKDFFRTMNLVKQKIGISTEELGTLGIYSVHVSGPQRSDTIFGSERMNISISGKSFIVDPASFLQVNDSQSEKLYGKVVEMANLTPEETLLDIYSGVGTISLIAGDNAKAVYGVEMWKKAVDDATENARLNGMENKAFFFEGKAEEVTRDLVKEGKISKPDVVIVDPPRSGCESSVLSLIAELDPSRLVYVSCKPSTLARDLKILCDSGFMVDEVQPVDMFCHSVHVETVVLMTRVEK